MAVPLGLAVLGLLFFAVWLLAGSPKELKIASDWAYDGAVAMAGVACLARAFLSPAVRWAWLAFAVGLIGWAAGDVYWTQELSELRRVPYPSLADVGYLMAPLGFFVGIALLTKERLGRFTLASCLDGLIGALATAALGTAILAPALKGLTRGDSAAVLTNLGYPVLDILLLALIAGTLTLGRPREARSVLPVAAGLLVWAGVDVHYLFLEATSSYRPGWIDVLWPLGALMIAAGALVTPARAASREGGRRSAIPLALPALFASVAVTVLIWDHFDRLPSVSVWLSGATVAAVVIRLALSSRENNRLLDALHDDAVTDALTGLGNRRCLFEALDSLLRTQPRATEPHLFALFDLDGFKAYNDTFGHPAGDVLLRRLGTNLTAAVAPDGTAYRLGGDEFCVLTPLGARRPNSIFAAARETLREDGEGFTITASGGWVILPTEATTAEQALRDADRAMYAEKSQRTASALHVTQEVLMRIFHEREPALGTHSEVVARLATALGRRLALDGEARDVLARAAELHDVGKIAIPDEILYKPDRLDDAEWELMSRHTLIGDRILGATAAMRPVAKLVRSSHERWDGSGYPDRLSSDEIPLGSRIIYICDSFDAMTSERPYQRAMSVTEALAELRRCAGSQFDPDLVEVFCELVQSGVEADGTRPLAEVGAARPHRSRTS